MKDTNERNFYTVRKDVDQMVSRVVTSNDRKNLIRWGDGNEKWKQNWWKGKNGKRLTKKKIERKSKVMRGFWIEAKG